MRIRLQRGAGRHDLYAESGIAPDTYVQVQNQSPHVVYIHAGAALPVAPPDPVDTNTYFELHPQQWDAFKGATLTAYTERQDADIVIDDASGMMICGVSAAIANGINDSVEDLFLPTQDPQLWADTTIWQDNRFWIN